MTDAFNSISGEKLRNFITRVERLEEDKSNVANDIREVYAEAKAHGFEPKIMRKVVQLRKIDSQKLQEQESLLELYKSVLNMQCSILHKEKYIVQTEKYKALG